MSTTKHKIKWGETFGGIAKQYGTTEKELMKLNPNIKDPNRIYAGDMLTIGDVNKIGNNATPGTNPPKVEINSNPSNPYNLPTAPTYQNTAWSDTDQGKDAWQAYLDALGLYNKKTEEGFKFSKAQDLTDVYNDIKGYTPFSYDVNSDALYQQYADQYTRLGKLAMQDTMGQAAAMTGGYGSSYATTAGNQAYQGYLQQLNEVVPELYQMALNKWQMGKDDLYDQYGLLLSEYEREYGLYSDEYNQLLDALGLARSDYYDGADMHYTEQGNYNDILATQFGDKMSIWDANQSQSNWDKQFAIQQESWDLEKAAYGDVFGTDDGDNSGSKDNSGNGSKENNTVVTSGGKVPSAISEKAATYKSNDALDDYLTKQRDAGKITQEQAEALYAEYEIPSLSKRDWTLTDDGGVNWLWGVDNNAVVKDQYGNSYRLDKLVDALVAEGMSKSEAKAYVKKLQKSLGA